MKIAIAGWYFRPQFLSDISISGYEAFVIKHREGDTRGIPSQLYPNVGLEFGAYRQYVENHWDGVSDVFFCHDDAEFTDLSGLAELEELNAMGVDHAYVFPDTMHEFVNGGAHGRGMWIRGSILEKLKADFPADMENEGVNIGLKAQRGILKFHARIMKCGLNTGAIAILPQLRFAHRGVLHDHLFVYRKHAPVPGGIVNAAQ